MTNKNLILESIKFIEDNLKKEINVLDMARSINYSQYHFIRLFQSVTGYSPKTYLQKRRLSEAYRELNSADKKVIEVALEYGFNSHESFTRSFKKHFGINPKNIKNGLSNLNFSFVKPIDEEFIFHSERMLYEQPQIIELPKIILLGTSFFVEDSGNLKDLSKQWSQFLSEVEIITPHKQKRFYQVQFWSDNHVSDGLNIFIGIETDNIYEEYPQFVIKILPASRYLCFTHKGLSNKVGHTYNYIYNHFLPDTDYKLTKPFNFEFYGEKYLGANNPASESEIYIPVE